MKYWIFFFLFYALETQARTFDTGYLDIVVNKEAGIITSEFEFNPKALGEPALPFHGTLGKSFWRAGSAKCLWRNTFVEVLSAESVRVSGQAICRDLKKDLLLDLSSLLRNHPSYRVMARIDNDGVESVSMVSRINRELRITQQQEKSFVQYIESGAQHISSSADHILFLLALLCAGGSLIQNLKTISGFSLGHTLSLVLSTLGILSIPLWLIDPFIALSIVIVAAFALLKQRGRERFWLGMSFGFIHGFGFATILNTFHMSSAKLTEALVGFNLGIELGQAFIVCLIIPVLYLLKKYSTQEPLLVRASAFGVMLVGCYWFIESASHFKNLT